jgi:hypothetical protein
MPILHLATADLASITDGAMVAVDEGGAVTLR